jgi:hypothetical protein
VEGALVGTGEKPVERGGAGEEDGLPASQIEVDAARRPPMVSEDDGEGDSIVEDDGSGMPGGSSGSSGGGSSMPGHPDAAR